MKPMAVIRAGQARGRSNAEIAAQLRKSGLPTSQKVAAQIEKDIAANEGVKTDSSSDPERDKRAARQRANSKRLKGRTGAALRSNLGSGDKLG